MAGDDEGFSFGDFNFATPQPQLRPQSINGGLIQDDDDDWGDFFVATSQPQLTFSNGFSLPSRSIPDLSINRKSSNNFDPFSFNPTRHAVDPGPTNAQKPRGALPLSLFGEVEEGIDEPDSIDSESKNSLHGLLDPNSSAQNGKIEFNIVSNGGGFYNNGDLFAANSHVQKKQINPVIGLGLNSGSTTAITMPSVKPTSAASASDLNNLDGGDGDGDEWEFMDAFSNGLVSESKEQGASVLPGSKVDAGVVMSQQKQAGQDAPSSAEYKDGSNSSMPQFVDLFAVHKSNEIDVGLNNVSVTVNSNGFMPDFFHGVGTIGDGSEINATSVNEDDDFDDFGDFVDASQEVGPRNQQEQRIPQSTVAHFPNGKIEDQQTQPENSKGPLPLSLFSDDLEESGDGFAHQDEVNHEPISNPGNGFGTQGLGLSIHDLLINLYSQAQQTSSINSNKSFAENGVDFPQKTEDATPFGDDDDWEDNSWEFKGASPETGIKDQSSWASPGTLSQTPFETTSNMQFYKDFCVKLKDSLCVLLSHQLNEEKKSQYSDTIGGHGNSEALSHDIQEAYRLLEGTEEILLKKHLDRSHCLSEVLEALQEPKCKVIESAYSLSERLPLATNDWRTAAELLRHVISVLHVLSLGSADDQSVYVYSWSKIISVCALELKHGALIWKRALEKNVQAEILFDHRGQQYIQALGEIYKVVELLRLSTKLYKPWMLLSVPDSQLLGLLEECESLWPSSGLEEALQNMSDNVGLGHNEAAKVLIASIKNIHNIDELAVHDCVFVQRQPICRLSLLPQEILSGLKVALWDKEPYFLNLANLWANLISHDPPQLPPLLVS